MKKKLLDRLICPNTGHKDLRLFAAVANRAGQGLSNQSHTDLRAQDDVEDGVVFSVPAGTAYPIVNGVLSMLSDEDADRELYVRLLGKAGSACPADCAAAIAASVARLASRDETETGQWNREEMEYYDAAVRTPELRAAFLTKIHNDDLPHIFIERKRHLLDNVAIGTATRVLEIGCGNARTMAVLSRPAEVGCDYVGTDISLRRLFLARLVIPEADFVQASAQNLPFRDASFDVVVAFGTLHHLPSPEIGFNETARTLVPGGSFLIHEPIDKPPTIPKDRMLWLRRKFEGYTHSEHDNEIPIDRIRELAGANGFDLTNEHYAVSIVRTLMTGWPLRDILPLGRRYWQMVIKLDLMFIKMFCRRRNRFGPGAAFLIFRRNAQ